MATNREILSTVASQSSGDFHLPRQPSLSEHVTRFGVKAGSASFDAANEQWRQQVERQINDLVNAQPQAAAAVAQTQTTTTTPPPVTTTTDPTGVKFSPNFQGGSPNGLVVALQPAIAYDAFGGIWIKTNSTVDDQGWQKVLQLTQ